MGNQTIKQQARRAALDAQTKRRAEHGERERRLQSLAVQVLVAIRVRDHAVVNAERRAGEALTEMIETEGLTARDAVQHCGGEVSTREVARLRRVVRRADAKDNAEKPSSRSLAEQRRDRADRDCADVNGAETSWMGAA